MRKGMTDMNFQKLFNELKRNAIITNYLPAEDELPAEKSKFGGKPYLPANISWPYYEGEDFDSCQKEACYISSMNLPP